MADLTSFIKHELNPVRIKGGAQRFDYWETVYGNTNEFSCNHGTRVFTKSG